MPGNNVCPTTVRTPIADLGIDLLRNKIRELVLQRDAYQLMEEGIKKLEDYNKLAAEINKSLPEGQWKWMMVFPVIFKENSPPDVREPGIYKDDIYRLTTEIIRLNDQLMIEFRKRKELKEKSVACQE